MEAITGIFLLATIIEGLITYLFGKSEDGAEERAYLKYVSLVLGIGAAIAYQVDLLAMVGLVSAVPFVGYIISGLVIGRGSNYLNDIISSFRK